MEGILGYILHTFPVHHRAKTLRWANMLSHTHIWDLYVITSSSNMRVFYDEMMMKTHANLGRVEHANRTVLKQDSAQLKCL